MVASHHHITRYEEYRLQVRSLAEVLESFGFKPYINFGADDDDMNGRVKGWDCMALFYPDENPLTLICLNGDQKKTFHISSDEELKLNLQSL